MSLANKYEIFNFLKKDEIYISGNEIIKRAGNNIATKKDIEYFLNNQKEIPKKWQKFSLVFNLRHPDDPEGVAFVCWVGDRWVRSGLWLGYVWNDNCRVLRRKVSQSPRASGRNRKMTRVVENKNLREIRLILCKLDWIKILKDATENRPTSWGDNPVREWRNASDEIYVALLSELRNNFK